MKKANLPTEKAQEPYEEARQPLHKTTGPQENQPKKHNVSFADTAVESVENTQSSNSYKEALSQPAPSLSQRQKLQWLQKRRTSGLWAQCDDCGLWRHLPTIIDSHELPQYWYCRMNPDKSVASCSSPEVPIRLRDEEDLIYSEYSAGSVVWARMAGWPWWPAMVDDCPDNEQYYWLDGFSDIPTHYNVVFFDTFEVTRAWIAPDDMKPYKANKNKCKYLLKNKRLKSRLDVAMTQANDAELLPLTERLEKYSFITRFKGIIAKPKEINKKVLNRFKNQIKRKFNVDFSEDSDSDDEENIKNDNKSNNNKIIGTPKKSRKITPKVLSNENNYTEKGNVEPVLTKSVEPDSMAVQIGSSELRNESPLPVGDSSALGSSLASKNLNKEEKTIDSDLQDLASNNLNKEDKTNTDIDSELQDLVDLSQRSVSPKSDDFEF